MKRRALKEYKANNICKTNQKQFNQKFTNHKFALDKRTRLSKNKTKQIGNELRKNHRKHLSASAYEKKMEQGICNLTRTEAKIICLYYYMKFA